MSFALSPDQQAAGRAMTQAALEVVQLQQRRMDNFHGANCSVLDADLVAQQRAASARQAAAYAAFKGFAPVAQQRVAA